MRQGRRGVQHRLLALGQPGARAGHGCWAPARVPAGAGRGRPRSAGAGPAAPSVAPRPGQRHLGRRCMLLLALLRSCLALANLAVVGLECGRAGPAPAPRPRRLPRGLLPGRLAGPRSRCSSRVISVAADGDFLVQALAALAVLADARAQVGRLLGQHVDFLLLLLGLRRRSRPCARAGRPGRARSRRCGGPGRPPARAARAARSCATGCRSRRGACRPSACRPAPAVRLQRDEAVAGGQGGDGAGRARSRTISVRPSNWPAGRPARDGRR